MADGTSRYAEHASLLGSRIAVVVTDDGLREDLRLGITRLTPWSRVRGTRWVAHDQAVVDLDDGSSLGLPEGIDELAELVAEIEQRAHARQQAWREGVPPERIREWLGIAPGGQLRASADAADRSAFGLSLAIGLNVLLLFVWAPAPIFLLALCLLLAARFKDVATTSVIADETGITYRGQGSKWHLAWSEVRSIESSFDFVTRRQTIHVRCGDTYRRLVLVDGCRLATTLEQVAHARRAGFLGAGRRPVPPTALSLTRLDEPTEAERGLSQVESDDRQ